MGIDFQGYNELENHQEVGTQLPICVKHDDCNLMFRSTQPLEAKCIKCDGIERKANHCATLLERQQTRKTLTGSVRL